MKKELLIGELQTVTPVNQITNTVSDESSQLILERLKLITDQNNHLSNKLNDLELDSSSSGGGLSSILYFCFILSAIIWGVGVFTDQGLNPIESFPKMYKSVMENEDLFGGKSD